MTAAPRLWSIPALGIGTSPLASMPAVYGYAVSEGEALATLRRVLDSPIRFIDTSNEYGEGRGEERVGAALSEAGHPGDVLVATKADPIRGGPFDAERVRASFEESRRRLGVERFGIFHLHDPERFAFEDIVAPGGAVEGMRSLRDDGLVDAIGVAAGQIDYIRRVVDLDVFDVVLNHNQYTLLDRSASPLIDELGARGIPFLNAAPFASGILAKPRASGARYQYGTPNAAIESAVGALHDLCEVYDVPLGALALQYSTRDPRIASTLVGVSAPERVDQVIAFDRVEIPGELWTRAAAVLELESTPVG